MIKNVLTKVKFILALRPDLSHRKKKAPGGSVNEGLDYAMEDDQFVKFFSHLQHTANYFVATHQTPAEQKTALNFLIAQAYVAGKRNGSS